MIIFEELIYDEKVKSYTLILTSAKRKGKYEPAKKVRFEIDVYPEQAKEFIEKYNLFTRYQTGIIIYAEKYKRNTTKTLKKREYIPTEEEIEEAAFNREAGYE